MEEWQYLWVDNPALRDFQDNWPIGLILEDDNNIVGYIANIPVAYEYNNIKFIAAAASSWVVDVNDRNHTIPSIARCFHQKMVDFLIITSADYESGKLCRLFRCKKVPIPSLSIPLF